MGLDYADQRYYSPGSGRFLTADPYEASAGAGDPGSWNRYAYVQGDPVNSIDPEGLKIAELSVGYYIDGIPFMGGGGGLFGGGGGAGTADPFNPCFGVPAAGFMRSVACFLPQIVVGSRPPKREEEVAKRVAHRLKIAKRPFSGELHDCYNVARRGAVTREIRYELYDEEDQRLSTGVVSETLTGEHMPISGKTSSSPTNNGVYTDTISPLKNAEPWELRQTFSVSVTGSDTVLGGTFNFEVWAFGGKYRELGLFIRSSSVFINGDGGLNAGGGLRECP